MLNTWITLFFILHGIESKSDLTIGGFYAVYDDGRVNLSSVKSAVELARTYIDQTPYLLDEYNLKVEWKDTQCSRKWGTYSLYQFISDNTTKVMLLGGYCSVATQPIAETAHLFNLVQIGYAASSPSLSNKDVYKSFFRTNPSEHLANYAIFALMKHFKWNKIGIIYENEDIFSSTAYKMLSLVEDKDDVTVEQQKFDKDPTQQINYMKEKDIRIFMGLFYEEAARKVMCAAYKAGLYGDRYLWILSGYLISTSWWTVDNSNNSCTAEEIEKSIENSLYTQFDQISQSQNNTVSGKTACKTWEEYIILSKTKGIQTSIYDAYAYDALWAIALTLNASEQVLVSQGKSLREFNYTNEGMADLIRNFTKQVTFNGITGAVSMDESGDREQRIIIGQIQGEKRVDVGYYHTSSSVLELKENRFIWPESGPPKAQVVTDLVEKTISKPLFIACTSIMGVGIMLALSFLVFNLSNSNVMYIKMSSPLTNNLIVIGCITLHIAGILLGLNSSGFLTSSNICQVTLWLLCTGFTMSFGAMFAKTWRVHLIFVKREENKSVSEWQLCGIVAVLLFLDFVILFTSTFISPMELIAKNSGDPVKDQAGYKATQYYSNYCTSEYQGVWEGITFAYKGVLLLFATFLAWETRNVAVAHLNDSRFIGISVYNVLVPCALGLPLVYLVQDDKDVVYGVTVFLIAFCTIVTLCLIFVPKIIDSKRDGINESVCNSFANPQVSASSFIPQPGISSKSQQDARQLDSDSRNTSQETSQSFPMEPTSRVVVKFDDLNEQIDDQTDDQPPIKRE